MSKKILLNEKIFVAGATGMVGNAICRSLFRNGYGKINGGQVLKPSRKELDLLDTNKVRQWFEINKPTIVIIAAAKVGGILANSKYPTQFLLDNLKIQNNLIENWKKSEKTIFLAVVALSKCKTTIKEDYPDWSIRRNKSMVWYCKNFGDQIMRCFKKTI